VAKEPKLIIMKRIVLGVAALSFLALVSCKKDYNCECKTSQDGTVIGETSTTINDTKKNAEEACEGLSVTAGTTTTNCHIHED